MLMQLLERCFKKCRKDWPFFWPYLILGLVSLVVLWPQFSSRSFFLNGDSLFHINQFYESAMQIKTDHFSWFLNWFGFGQSGRIVNALYGPVFSYLIGGVLLLSGTWFRTQLLLEYGVTLLGSFFMYHLLRSIHLGRLMSLILGIIYASSFPITSLIQNQNFDGIGNVLMPLVILMGLRIWRDRQVPIIPLAILLAIIMQIHILTVLVASVALIPFALVSFWKTARKWRWLAQFGLSIMTFLLLTGNIWGLTLSLFSSNDIIKPFPNHNLDADALFWSRSQPWSAGNFFIVIIGLLLVLMLINWRHLDPLQRTVPFLAFVYTFVASAYFPWNYLNRCLPLIGQILQFPYRFLGVALVLVLLALGQNLQRLLRTSVSPQFQKTVVPLVMAGLFLIAGVSVIQEEQMMSGRIDEWTSGRSFSVNYHSRIGIHQLKAAFNQDHNFSLAPHDMVKPVPDYLPSNRPLTALNYFSIAPYWTTLLQVLNEQPIRDPKRPHESLIKPRNSPIHFHKTIDHHCLMVWWNQPKRLDRKWTVLPLVKYAHTQVVMNHQVHHLKMTRVGAIALHPQAGHHQVAINYRPAGFVTLLLWITAISWLALFLYP